MNKDQLLKQGIDAARRGDKVAAHGLLRRVVQANRWCELGWLWLAYVESDPREVSSCLQEVLSVNPFNEDAKFALKNNLLQVGIDAAKSRDFARANELLSEALTLDPENALIVLWLAVAATDRVMKVRHLHRVLELQPGHETALSYLRQLESRPEEKSHRPPAPMIMIVDDSPTVRRVVVSCLVKQGFEVHEAGDAMEAFAALDELSPAVILLDIGIPHIDGFQFCRLLKASARTRDFPIVMLSGRASEADVTKARELGFTNCVEKPFEHAVLLAAIEAARSGRSAWTTVTEPTMAESR